MAIRRQRFVCSSFSQFCNLAACCTSLFQLICNLLLCRRRRARPPAVRTTAQPYTAGRPTPPRLPSVFWRDLRSVAILRTASLLSGNSVLHAGFFRRRLTPPRLPSVFQRFCAGRARGEPSAELPAARVRRQWFMTEEEGVRLRSNLFWENGPAGVCKAVFAEPIALISTKLQGRGSLVFL